MNEKEFAKSLKEKLFPLMKGKLVFEGCIFGINGTKDDKVRWFPIGSQNERDLIHQNNQFYSVVSTLPGFDIEDRTDINYNLYYRPWIKWDNTELCESYTK